MICIEISHIYANETWSEEQENSWEIGQKIQAMNQASRMCVLVDNYHAQGFIQLPSRVHNARIIFEKDLCNLAEDVINKLPKHLLREEEFRKEQKTILFLVTPQGKIALKTKQNNKIKYTCALLSSTWHLSRANLVSNPWFSEGVTQLISILPRKFEDIELKVKYILNIIHPNFPLEHRFF